MALATVVLGPALGPGLVLSYDMSPVPEPSFSWEQLGLGYQLPRAVPLDAVVTAAAAVLPAALVQKGLLLVALVAAGWGAARLVDDLPVTARLVAATTAVWNPFVAERLVLGHWGLLLAYGALPWLVRSLLLAPADRHPGQVLLLAVCGLTPTGGLLSLVVLLVAWALTTRVAPNGPTRRVALVVPSIAWLLVNATWWLPGLLHGGSAVVDRASVDAFAARPELPGGVLPTLLGLGGIWNADVVPPSRGTPLAVLALLVTAGLVAAGARSALRGQRRLTVAVSGLAAAGLGLALVGVLPGTSAILGWAVATVPGGGLLRDGHKFVALAMPALAVLSAHGAQVLRRRVPDPGGAAVLAGAVLLPLALLPDLAWGAAGRLDAVTYPSAWHRVREAVVHERADGNLLLLPWGAFRAYPWNGDRTVLDPARRAFPRDVVGDDRLVVGSTVLAGEDPRSRTILRSLRRGGLDADLMRSIGIRLVLLQPGQPGVSATPPGTVTIARGPGLRLLRVPGQVAPAPAAVGRGGRTAVVAVDLLAAAAVLAAAAHGARRSVHRRAAGRPPSGSRPA